MDDDYFSISSILADNHKLSCTFSLEVPGLGYLEGGSEHNIHANSKLELPFWIAQTLSLNEFTTFPLPPAYSNRVRAALNASAPSVKLSNLMCTSLLSLTETERSEARKADVVYKGGLTRLDDQPQADLLGMLLRAFIGRLPPLQDLSAHHASTDKSVPETGHGTGESFREGMEGDERQLFTIGQDSGRMVKAWYDTPWGTRRR